MIDSSSNSSSSNSTVDVLVVGGGGGVAATLWWISISISLFNIIVADPVRRPYGTKSTNDSDGCTMDTLRYRRMYVVVVVVGVHLDIEKICFFEIHYIYNMYI